MFEDLPFRLTVLALAIGFQVLRWPTRHLTGWNATWSAMKKNPADGLVLSTSTVLWISAVVIYAVFYRRLTALQWDFPDALRWVGLAFGVAAIALTRWADYTLGKNLSIVVQVKDDHTLVTDGPYAWIRHPIYTATILFAIGLVLVSANALVTFCAVTAASLLLSTRIFEEERLMTVRFGDGYRQYMHRTGRLLPRHFRRFKHTHSGEARQTQ